MQPRARKNSGGFTLLEVILSLLLISIFAVATAARQPTVDVTLKSAAMNLKSQLRYAQMRSMNTSTPWGVRYDNGMQAYWLYQGEDPDDPVNQRLLPGGTQLIVDQLAQQSITVAEGDFALSFDSWGRPAGLAFVAGRAGVTLSKDGRTEPIVIIENSGFIQ